MRILILLTKKQGGVGFANQRLANKLIKEGHKVKIISRKENLKSEFLINSIFKIRNYIKKNSFKYDIIYTQDWNLAFPLLFPYPIYFKKHFCCFCGNQEGLTKILQNLIGKIIGKKLIVVADSLKARFPNSTIIYRGIDYKSFKPLKKKRKYLGWVDKDTEIIDKKFISKLSSKLGIKCLIAKNIPPEKMNEFYNKCKIFVSLPPSAAGMNNVWAEAMAAGVPIIIGNEKGLGSHWPYQKISGKNLLQKCIDEIKNPKKIDYRKWLKKNKISWDNSANKLIKNFKKCVG